MESNHDKGMIEIQLCAGTTLVHRKTGKPIHMVAERTGSELLTCHECGHAHKVPTVRWRPAKWYRPENIVEVKLPDKTLYVPIYKEGS